MTRRLFSFEAAWTDAAFDAIYPAPPSSALAHGVLDMKPGEYLGEVLASVPLEQSLGLRLTLWMIALAPLFTVRKLATIASLAPADRKRVLERLITSPVYVVRQLTMGMKAVATLLYARSPVVRAQMSTPIRAPQPLVGLRTKNGRSPATTPAVASGTVSETRVKRGAHEHDDENAAE